ncbi:hypothetical protein FD755_022907 [Muntiacus reevesi]|uniref:Uncharacterized protein n=1 Tax=Muntiacus reevesi TaxID=9886 RepID=A0A5N3VYN3_MUNRE|nr:hypothetical protein FD755_022907 [Muntiacus reevesi]
MEAQGLSFTQVRLLEGKFSFCIENKNGTGLFLGDIPKQYCNQALWLDSTDGGTSNPPWMTGQYSWSADHTNGTWNSSAVSLADLSNAPGYKGANQNSGMTWAGNDTYLYSCQNWTEGLHHQMFHNPFCYDNLTEAHGKWRCTDANITNDRGHHGHQAPIWWVTGSTLTLSANTSGLFILCGNKVYKGFPYKWSGRCGLGYLAPSSLAPLTRYPTLNDNPITSLGSFRHKVAPHRHIQPDDAFSSLRTSDPEEAILNISRIMELGLTTSPHTLKVCPPEFGSFASVLQNHHLLAPWAAQQESRCAIVGRQCCFVSQQEQAEILPKMRKAWINWTDLFSRIRDWFSKR